MDSSTQSLRIRIRQNASVKEKTIIRVVAETLKKLVQEYQIKSAEEILSSLEIQALRYKLKECLNRLIFLEPLEFGQKAEDTIWKSIFYEPIRIFKRELKTKPHLINSKSLLLVSFQRHIIGAIGYYQKLILRLQTEFGLCKEMCPDFKRFLPCNDEDEKEILPELKSWAFSCIQHSLLYIGDLYRYEHDIKCTNSRVLATRYYNMVLMLNPSLGHAYNQLATLDTLSYYGLNAAYFYLKAQLCSNSFLQAKDNLLILFERNVKRLRSVLDRESLMKKSGSNISKSSLKIVRVKSSIIKYLNVWHSFTTPSDMNHYDIKQLAAMCDDMLNILSFVLGFDRKLVSNLSSSDSGVRPSTLNVKTVTQILFIASSCLEIMRLKKNEDGDLEQMKYTSMKFDLAHSFVLNLYGHVFNQCLVRMRDELRSANIDVSLLFRRYDSQEKAASLVDTESCDEANSVKPISASQTVTAKPKKKRIGLAKRLVRARHDTDGTNNDEDLSEDDQNLSENDNLLWDDNLSSSSDSDNDNNGRGFGFSDVDDETDFESNEEIHSQDEDDQIIRAIVGHNTVFGRYQAANAKDNKKQKDREPTNTVIFTESSLIDESHQGSKTTRRRSSSIHAAVNTSGDVKPAPESLVPCVYNVDLLQSLSVVLMAFYKISENMLESFSRVWHSSPYLWKHFSVTLNFCENILDDIVLSGNTTISRCSHCTGLNNIRAMPPCVLPEDSELILSATAPTNKENTSEIIRCDNILHQVVTRVTRIINCGHYMASLPQGPISVQQQHIGNLWIFSHSHNAPRTNLVSKSWNQIFANTGDIQMNVPPTNTDKEKVMREMARLRLKNELPSNPESDINSDHDCNDFSTKSGSPSSDAFRSVYLIPDVDYICGRLDAIKSLVKSQRYICVIPQAVIQRLDRIKTQDHGARQAIKYLEGEMQLNNEHIKIESAATALKSQDMACDVILDWPAIEATAIRLVDESVIKSMPRHDIVVTVLTGSASKLSIPFSEHYAIRRIDFQSSIDL